MPNKSTKPRVAFAGIIVPKHSQPIHYFHKNGKLLVYDATEEFFCQISPGEEPIGIIKEELNNWFQTKSIDLSNFILSLEKDGK